MMARGEVVARHLCTSRIVRVLRDADADDVMNDTKWRADDLWVPSAPGVSRGIYHRYTYRNIIGTRGSLNVSSARRYTTMESTRMCTKKWSNGFRDKADELGKRFGESAYNVPH
jgi:hypothetical protein